MTPNFLSEMVRAVIIMTITGGLLCLLLLAIRPFIRYRLPKAVQYYCWLMVLGALLIPVSRIVTLPGAVPVAAPVHSIVERNVVSIAEDTARLYAQAGQWPAIAPTMPEAPASVSSYPTHGSAPTTAQAPPVTPLPVRVSSIFIIVYPWVALFVLLYSLIGYVIFIKKLCHGYVNPHGHELDMLREMAQGKRIPGLIRSTHAVTPMLIGFLRPVIVLPDREYSSKQLYGIFLHELTHMRRLDVAVKWLSLFACAVHWFNPLVWVARREINRTCELACDEAVIRNMDANTRQNYGETLIAVASDRKIPLSVLSTTLCTEKKAIRERLTAIMGSRGHTRLAVLASVIVVVGVVGVVLVLGAGRGNEAAVIENNGESYVIEYDTTPLSAPQEHILSSAVTLHGISGGSRMDGVTGAWLIDFNNDGEPKLFLTISEDFGWRVRYLIYNRDGMRVYDGLATPFSTGPTSYAIAFTESNNMYLRQYTHHMWGRNEYFTSFVHGLMRVPLARYAIPWALDDENAIEYTVNGNIVDAATHNEAHYTMLGIVEMEHPSVRFAPLDLSQFVSGPSFMELIRTEGERFFTLENMTERQSIERMTSVTLYADGTATLAQALISSYMLPASPYLVYSIDGRMLVISRNPAQPWLGIHVWGDIEIARFMIIDNNTLEFYSANVPLFADYGARYVISTNGADLVADTPHEDLPNILCHCGEHYIGQDLRQPTPPLNIREWNEVDESFLDNFGPRQGLAYIEHSGDLANPVTRVEEWWGHSQLEYHTMLIWADQEIYDFRVVALGFDETGDTMSFYVRHELLSFGWLAPNNLLMINASLLHYLIPRMGITFTDAYGNNHRMLISESMRGGCFPLFNLAVHDESHFALWDDTRQPLPFVIEDMGSYNVRGLGGRIMFDPGQRTLFFAGFDFDVPGLYGEHIEGSAELTQDSIRVGLAVARNEIIMAYTDGPLGTLAGPSVTFEYVPRVGIIDGVNQRPFVFYNDAHVPLYFELPEEGAIELVQLLLRANELIVTYREIVR